ncbi:hypothetical protein R6Q59_023512 [Mikania micrantha]
MHFKESSGWYSQLTEQHWDNITDEMNRAKSALGGDETPVDEVEVLERSLGHRRGHIRGVGRTVKSITTDLRHHMYAPTNELQQQLAEANAHWRSNNTSMKRCNNRLTSSCRCKAKDLAHLITPDINKMKMTKAIR